MSRLQHCQAVKEVIHTWLLEPDQISYTESMVANWEAVQIGPTFILIFESRFKHSMAEFQSIWFWFHSKKEKKTKNANARVWSDVCGDQKPATFFGP